MKKTEPQGSIFAEGTCHWCGTQWELDQQTCSLCGHDCRVVALRCTCEACRNRARVAVLLRDLVRVLCRTEKV